MYLNYPEIFSTHNSYDNIVQKWGGAAITTPQPSRGS